MTGLFLSKIQLKQDNAVKTIAASLLGEDHPQTALAAKHRLIWSLFGDKREQLRDFLWREDKRGAFYTLSKRPPANLLFDVQSTEFTPHLAPGDRLAFTLRANPVIAVKQPGIRRGQRRDVVMHALHDYRPWRTNGPDDDGQRRHERDRLIVETGVGWLEQQGERNGFRPLTLKIDGYEQHLLPRGDGKRQGTISTLDFEGSLTVTDPALFLDRLARGFGSARAFGCGLMLIRRA